MGLDTLLDLLPDETNTRYRFIYNGIVAEVTSLQSARYRYLKCDRSPEKVMACISPAYMHSLKFR